MSAPTLATPTQGVSLAQFDPRSGSLVERALFNHRLLVIVLCAVVTLLLGWQATRLQLNASFEKTIPTGHPYIANFLTHQSELSGLGNVVRIAVARPEGSLYDAKYLDTLRRLISAPAPGAPCSWATAPRPCSKPCKRLHRKASALAPPPSARSSWPKKSWAWCRPWR